MNWGQLDSLVKNLAALGWQRLSALAAAFVLVVAGVIAASHYGSRSGFETLYVGLSQQDVSRMGAVLAEAGIPFESSTDGTKIGVVIGQAGPARALLAEKGLPGGPTAGYELFDKIGALGLTSFMQQVTRVRALEGELSRTIQHIKGVRAARVHLALPEQNVLRTNKQPPTASVIIRTDSGAEAVAAQAIRHLVAAAIPELSPDHISVIGADGKVLAGGLGEGSESSSKMIDLEQAVAKQINENVTRTLSAYLGLGNFEVSSVARLNIDRIQSNETNYDPEKRVERSTRVVKQNESSQDSTGSNAVGVDQNIPNEGSDASAKDQTKRAQDRKEETTNYEVSSKSSTSVSEGYRISNISVAIVVNRKRFADGEGKPAAEDVVKSQISEIQRLAQSAAGINSERGDKIEVAAVDFAETTLAADASESQDWTMVAMSLLGALIKGATVVGVAAIVVFAGFRPALRVLVPAGGQPMLTDGGGLPALGGPGIDGITAGGAQAALNMPEMASPLLDLANPFEQGGMGMGSGMGMGMGMGSGFGSSGFGRPTVEGPVERLAGIFDSDEDQATAVLKHWIRSGR